VKDEPEKQKRYHQLGESYFWFASQNEIVEQTLQPYLSELRAKSVDGALRIFDLGCGPGNMLGRLQRFGTAIGSDFSREALAFARGKGLSRLLSADSTALPLSSGSIDCLVALDVLEHIEDDGAALREIARVLRVGGIFVFGVPAFPVLWRHHDVMYGHYRRYRKPEFVEKVGKAGLTVENCRFIKCGFFLPLLGLALLERWAPRLMKGRDNFYPVPGWVNTLMAAEIIWEDRTRLNRRGPFGVSLLCVGRR